MKSITKKLYRYLLTAFELAAHALYWAYPAFMMAIAIVILYICVSGIIQANEVFKQERIKREQH